MSETINILLVDDEPRNLDALEAILTEPSYRLLRADEADKALRLLLENDVAAIVLDIKMPVVSGFELAKMIKGTKRFRQIPIVFLTAHLVGDQDILTGYGAGAVDYLTKPVNPEILRHKIATFADLYRKTRALAELNEHLERRVRERTAELEKSEEALRAANKQKDQFLATLAHELRNPLAPLRTGLDLLLQQPEQSGMVTRTIGAMNRQLSHMVRLIDDLLDVSRISRGKLEMRMEEADLATVIERAIETAQPALSRRNQRVVVDAAAPLLATVDPTRIAQVVGNLLSNASKHSPSGAEIRIELQRANETALIRVVDHGVGIPADQLERVFEMFTKIERGSTDANDGLGIGLSLSRHLLQLHQGSLSVSSAGEGQGATFTLAIPLRHATTNDTPALGLSPSSAEPTPPPAAAAPNGAAISTLRVVVVEDNDDSADMMCIWVERLGHEVRVARNGPEGLDVIMASQPDVVLCDIGLPGMDGVELCRRVIGGLHTPPLMVALTGWGMEADRARTADAGFRHHLVKPVAMDQLRDVLRSVRR
jgi:signal transduction histidine kinase